MGSYNACSIHHCVYVYTELLAILVVEDTMRNFQEVLLMSRSVCMRVCLCALADYLRASHHNVGEKGARQVKGKQTVIPESTGL